MCRQDRASRAGRNEAVWFGSSFRLCLDRSVLIWFVRCSNEVLVDTSRLLCSGSDNLAATRTPMENGLTSFN